MQVAHTNETRADHHSEALATVRLTEDDGLLAGAVECCGGDGWNVERWYKAFSYRELPEIEACSRWYVTGPRIETVEEHLRNRERTLHDIPRELSNLERVQGFQVTNTSRTVYGRRSSNRNEGRFDGWIVHPKPVWTVSDIELLKEFSARYGPVILPPGVLGEYRDGEDWAIEGFTYRETRSGRAQVNWNPMAIARRPYLQARRDYDRRMLGDLPQETLDMLVKLVHPDAWPAGHPFHDVVRGNALSETYGWGNRRNIAQRERRLFEYIALSRKLWPRGYGWWRDTKGRPSYYDSWYRTVEEALGYVHGMEATYWESLEEALEQGAERYFDMCETIRKSEGSNAEVDRFRPFMESYLSMNGGEMRKRIYKMCRFLRKEARAMKIKMPKPPVVPLTPTQEKRLKQRKAKARAAARKCRRADRAKLERAKLEKAGK